MRALHVFEAELVIWPEKVRWRSEAIPRTVRVLTRGEGRTIEREVG